MVILRDENPLWHICSLEVKDTNVGDPSGAVNNHKKLQNYSFTSSVNLKAV